MPTNVNMDFVHGERVNFDLDSGQVEPVAKHQEEAPTPAFPTFVGDILERNPSSTANPPPAPTFKPNTTGFPAHKKRASRVSAFKQQRNLKNEVSGTSRSIEAPKTKPAPSNGQDERETIDHENKQRIADMSPAEIEQERNELFSALSPSLIQRLLGRSNIDEGSNEQELMPEAEDAVAPTDKVEEPQSPIKTPKKVSFAEPEPTPSDPFAGVESATHGDETPTEPDTTPSAHSGGSIHFPKPPQPPDLDPNSPSFLEDLHEKYFPNLPYDPSSLSWMAPIDLTDTRSPYHPSQTAFNASELRFDFKGALLAPSKARAIPVTEGLHHHADAPEAAGYTIPELSILARSAVPAQRCIAFQILGRILYRLGQGEYGQEKERKQENGSVRVAINPGDDEEQEVADDDEAGSAMATGLWNCIEQGKAIETLTLEAAKEKGHLTAKSYAQEALWNWRRGGGRKRQAV